MATTTLVLALAFVLGLRSVSAVDCEVSCTGHALYDKVPNPLDCTQFYICLSETEYVPDPFDCGGNEHFNETTNECEEGSECDNLCGSSCTYECSETGISQISDRYDCSSYYQCSDGNMLGPFPCPSDSQFFDGSMCQSDEDKCCNCKPYCREEDVNEQVSDPRNCTNYYFCIEAGFPTIHGTCPNGNYDPFLSHCSETIPCITICPEKAARSANATQLTCQSAGYFPRLTGECDSCFYHCLSTDKGDYRMTELCCPAGMVFCPGTSMCSPPRDCLC